MDHLPLALQYANERADRWRARHDAQRDRVAQLEAELREAKAEAWDEGHRLHSPVREFGETPCDCRNPHRDERENALRAIAPDRYTPEDF